MSWNFTLIVVGPISAVFARHGLLVWSVYVPARSSRMPHHISSVLMSGKQVFTFWRWLRYLIELILLFVTQVSPKKIIVEAEETWMKNFLEDLGFEVILVPFRNVLEFGGSLHCSTWDINRDDEKKEYLTGENGDVAEHSRQTNGH